MQLAALVAVESESAKPAESATNHQKIEHPAAPVEAVANQRTDSQTGLPNRTAFCEDIRRRLAETHRNGSRLSVMFIKVDNLSELTAQHGSLLGDLVLHTCTQFLSAAMRDMDLVARYEADVFGIVLPGTALVHATGAGERLRSAIEQCPLRVMDTDIRFSVSVGVAEAQPGEDWLRSSSAPRLPKISHKPTAEIGFISIPAFRLNRWGCNRPRRNDFKVRGNACRFTSCAMPLVTLATPTRQPCRCRPQSPIRAARRKQALRCASRQCSTPPSAHG